MVMVPVRAVFVVFRATVYATVPFPLPDAPEVTVIHGTSLVAVHGQPDPAVTADCAIVAVALGPGAMSA